MNMLQIALKEIKHDFRDIRTLMFMFAFPVVLILVLGSSLSGAFKGEVSIDDMYVLYEDTNNSTSQSFETFAKEAAKSGVHFKMLPEGLNGKDEVEEGKADGFVINDQAGIHLFVNERNSLNGIILQGFLSSYVDTFNLITVVTKKDSGKFEAEFTLPTKQDYIQEHAILSKKQPGSMDYYAIVVTTMIALYAAMASANVIRHERSRNTAARLMVAPINKRDIFIGKVLGSIVMNGVCVALVVVFSMMVYRANWGEHLGLVFLVLLTEVILAVSFGLGMGFLMKSPIPVIMIVVQLASFFGGAYFKIENPEGIFKFITYLSPLTLENKAIINMVYANDLSFVLPAIGMNLGLAILFLLISSISLRQQEVL